MTLIQDVGYEKKRKTHPPLRLQWIPAEDVVAGKAQSAKLKRKALNFEF